jgi:DNA-directed RNA polymerase specialized sigma24 family protein
MSLFPATEWTQVLAAASRDPERAHEAAVALCGTYRAAIVRWFERDPRTRAQAEDLAHDFLSRWLVRSAPLGDFQRGTRRFREFLATCLRRFATESHARATAGKRGGGAEHEPLVEDQVPAGTESPGGDALDLELARQIFEEVEAALAERWRPRVPGDGYLRLRSMALAGEIAGGYAGLAAELGVPVGTFKAWIFRLRQEYYQASLGRVRTLTGPEEAAEELRHLHALLRRHGQA